VARAIWTGSLSFGLVNVPVGVYAATEDKTIHFNQLQRDTSDRVRNKRVNERTGEEVPYDEIVKGYDLGGGRYVIVDSDELESVEPGRSRNIEITDFVDLAEIDPVFYKSTYYLAPQGRDAQRAYALLRQAMFDENKVGVATFVLRNKQHLVAVRPADKVLALETMYFADEVRDPLAELDTLPGEEVSFRDREIETAKLLIESMTTAWEPGQYRDTYREAVEELIEAKSRGEIVEHERPEEPAPVVDLMEALRKSVEAARDKRSAAAGGAPAPSGAQAGGSGRSRAVKAAGGAKAGASKAAAPATSSSKGATGTKAASTRRPAKARATKAGDAESSEAPAQSSRRRKAS
jgi:DNA end-binding protein Ku